MMLVEGDEVSVSPKQGIFVRKISRFVSEAYMINLE